MYAAPDLFPGGIPDYEADYDHGGNPAGNVDLERLSAALSGAGYGAVDWGTMMAMLVLAIVPIIIFYAACQKYIIEGVVAGAVKG